jgi:hypothetical protein
MSSQQKRGKWLFYDRTDWAASSRYARLAIAGKSDDQLHLVGCPEDQSERSANQRINRCWSPALGRDPLRRGGMAIPAPYSVNLSTCQLGLRFLAKLNMSAHGRQGQTKEPTTEFCSGLHDVMKSRWNLWGMRNFHSAHLFQVPTWSTRGRGGSSDGFVEPRHADYSR